MIHWILLIALAALGLYDLYLELSKQQTVTQKLGVYFRDWPKWAGYVVMIVTVVLGWWLCGGITFALPLIIGIVIGHLLWND
jgi:hypothetical protein